MVLIIVMLFSLLPERLGVYEQYSQGYLKQFKAITTLDLELLTQLEHELNLEHSFVICPIEKGLPWWLRQ